MTKLTNEQSVLGFRDYSTRADRIRVPRAKRIATAICYAFVFAILALEMGIALTGYFHV